MKSQLIRLLCALGLVLVALGTLPAPSVSAATLTVNSLNDPGNGTCDVAECTLREAIAAAAAGDTIDFSITGILRFGHLQPQLVIDKNLNISGPGPASLTIDGYQNDRVFYISQGRNLNISGVTIINGYVWGGNGAGFYVQQAGLSITDSVIHFNHAANGGNGGGIYNYQGTVTITNTIFLDNSAYGSGGGIYSDRGIVTITNSTFSGNQGLMGSGGGVYSNSSQSGYYANITGSTFSTNSAFSNGGGVYNGGESDVIIVNSTFSDNHATNGGGIFNEGHILQMSNSTISANGASFGGGIYNGNRAAMVGYTTFYGNTANAAGGGGIYMTSPSVGFSDSILAASTGGNCAGSAPVGGADLGQADDATCAGFTQKTLAQLALGPLTGSPAYYPLLSGSHAIDAAVDAFGWCPATDQRGTPRPLDGNQDGTIKCDFGSYEVLETTTTAITADAPEPSVTGQAISVSVTVSGGSSTPTGTVDVTGADGNCTINLTAGSGSCNARFDTTGSKTLTATYNSDATHLGSSDTESHNVSEAGTTLIISDMPDPSYKGQVVTITFTVTANPPGSGTPTGTIDLLEGLVILCDNVALTSGSGSCIVPFNSYGSHSLSAMYSGDSNFNTSTDTEGHQVNDRAPTGIGLSPASVEENAPEKTAVGIFTTSDADPGETFVYALVSGSGSEDNDSFNIQDDELFTGDVFDFETQKSYSIRVRTTDSGGLSFEDIFTISVTDVNEAPTDISLSNNSVAENLPTGTAVGTLTTSDPDQGDTHTYSFCGGADDASFQFGGAGGDELQTATIFDHETKDSYAICICSADQDKLTYEKNFIIAVNDVNEAPVISEGASTHVTMDEDGSPITFNLTLHAIDPDGNTITWNISTPAGHGTATASGTGASKIIGYVPNLNYNGSDDFAVRVSDGILTDTITVNVTINSLPDISGNAGVANAILGYLDGSAKIATADGGGNYSFQVSNNWTGTVTPSKTEYNFSPVDRTYTSILVDQTDQNYIAALNTYLLNVSKTGAGFGTAISNPDGIDCGSTCSHSFDYNTSVTLTAYATTGSTFTGWSGSGCVGTGPCTVIMNSAKSVTANYTQNEYTLTITSANGTVTKNPDKVTYHEGDAVQLTATPGTGWSFVNWTGALTGSANPGSVTIHGNTSVTANYTQIEYTLTVTTAHGTVVRSPDQATYHEGDVVQLTATPGTGWSFANWTGALTGSANPGSVTIHGNTSVTANYTQNTYRIYLPLVIR